MATPVTGYVTLPSRFPDYGVSCTWNISAENQLSRLNITIDDNSPPYQRGPNCYSLQVRMFAGELSSYQNLDIQFGEISWKEFYFLIFQAFGAIP